MRGSPLKPIPQRLNLRRKFAALPSGAPSRWRRGGEHIYGAVVGAFHRLYDRGVRRPLELPVPVVSVGNLTAGGTGKTPAVKALCDAALGAGYQPAVLTRGYGGRDPSGVILGGKQHRRPADAVRQGDEPVLLSRAMPRVPVLVGRDRHLAAIDFLNTGAEVDVFILDDGFQHRRLNRDADLVLVDVGCPLGNGHLLPAGPLREAPVGLARADSILLTGLAGAPEPTPEISALLDRLAPGVPRLNARTRLIGLKGIAGDRNDIPASLEGVRVHAVAGIARPERFRGLLEAEGALVETWSDYPDHHRFRPEEVRQEERRALASRAVPITTAKDATRLESLIDAGAGWLRTEIALELETGWDRLLMACLKNV